MAKCQLHSVTHHVEKGTSPHTCFCAPLSLMIFIKTNPFCETKKNYLQVIVYQNTRILYIQNEIKSFIYPHITLNLYDFVWNTIREI